MAGPDDRFRLLFPRPRNRRPARRSGGVPGAADRAAGAVGALRDPRRLRRPALLAGARRRRRAGLAGDPDPDGGRLRLVGLADQRSLDHGAARALGSASSCSTPSGGSSAGAIIRKLDRTSSAGSSSAKARPTERLKAYTPLRARATHRLHRRPPTTDDSKPVDRAAALEIVDRYHANRVVIASRHADDEGLLDVVRAFKSTGVPVSLLPRPLDLLDAPVVTPSQVGGVPLIDVETLAARQSVPYAGPDRRRDRKTQGQRRRPGDERGPQHRTRAAPSFPRTCTR